MTFCLDYSNSSAHTKGLVTPFLEKCVVEFPLLIRPNKGGPHAFNLVRNTKYIFQFKRVLESYDFLFNRGIRAGVFSLYF